jgi:hypothetical protein
MSRQRSFRITHQVGYKHQLRWGKQEHCYKVKREINLLLGIEVITIIIYIGTQFSTNVNI